MGIIIIDSLSFKSFFFIFYLLQAMFMFDHKRNFKSTGNNKANIWCI